MKEMQITEKTTKKGLVDYLKSYIQTAKVVDKNLSDRINYALTMFGKNQTKVAKADLFDLANEVMQSLTPAPAPVEASLKPKKKTGGITKSKKSETPAEEVEDESEATEEETAVTKEEAPAEKSEPKKSGKKKSSLKKSDKDSKKKTEKSEIETLPPATNVGADHLPSAKMFPAEIDHPELGKIVSCFGAYTTYAEILKALEEEKTLYFACYWTKRQIREYGYREMLRVEAPKGGFPLDLDITMAVLPCETMERLFTMSRITEALYQFDGEDFKYIEDVDPRGGEKFQIRVSEGMEYEIYRPADEEIITIE